VPFAVITLDFDPTLHLGGWSVPWETVGIGAAILLALVLAAVIAGRTSEEPDFEPRGRAAREDEHDVPVGEPADDGMDGYPPADERTDGNSAAGDRGLERHLRRDDVLLIALGVLPGAVVGGRLVYGLVHLDYFRAQPGALLDPSIGSLSVSGAVLGGILTGAAVAHLLGPSLERWMRAATAPVLVALALGKAALALGGAGQGLPTSGPTAVRFAGPGPWSDPLATVPAQPSQLLEAVAVLLALLVVALLAATRAGRSGTTVFAIAIALWALARTIVASTWRDPTILGPLRAEQLVCVAIAAVSVVAATVPPVLRRRRGRRAFDPA
jgi:prolipoprotein diacylglyceryltransferase